jgi:hypothetical protein
MRRKDAKERFAGKMEGQRGDSSGFARPCELVPCARSEPARDGNKSCPNAARFTMKTIALHAAKNSHPTTNKYESVISMNLGLRREASCSRPRALDDQTLFGRVTTRERRLKPTPRRERAARCACASPCALRGWPRFPSSWPAGPASAIETVRCECASFAPSVRAQPVPSE